jgi:hypothetical protein
LDGPSIKSNTGYALRAQQAKGVPRIQPTDFRERAHHISADDYQCGVGVVVGLRSLVNVQSDLPVRSRRALRRLPVVFLHQANRFINQGRLRSPGLFHYCVQGIEAFL